jgi:hypothetical protein
MRFDLKTARERLCRDLQLPWGDKYTQDWAYELPDQFRTIEWLGRYLDAYASPDYGKSEQRLLMQLMLDVVNDLFEREKVAGQAAWTRLAAVLREGRELHRDQLEYWTLPDHELEDAFRLTPLARSLCIELYGSLPRPTD